MNKDYSHLEGKIIDWIATDGVVYKAKVAVIDYDIGLTLVVVEDVDWKMDDGTIEKLKANVDELTCLNGPSSPHGTTRSYDSLFRYYCTNEALKASGCYWLGPMAACAFK